MSTIAAVAPFGEWLRSLLPEAPLLRPSQNTRRVSSSAPGKRDETEDCSPRAVVWVHGTVSVPFRRGNRAYPPPPRADFPSPPRVFDQCYNATSLGTARCAKCRSCRGIGPSAAHFPDALSSPDLVVTTQAYTGAKYFAYRSVRDGYLATAAGPSSPPWTNAPGVPPYDAGVQAPADLLVVPAASKTIQ